MKLYSLVKDVNCRVFGNSAVEISGLYHKDTEVKEHGLFFCLRGTNVDGTSYVKSAIRNGAVAVVTEQEIHGIAGTTQIVVRNAREAMSLIACKFFGNPANKLKIIGVTGTNGKTTTTHMLSNMLECVQKKTAVLGTNGVMFSGKRYDSGLTTPDPIELQKYFSMMVCEKVEYVLMEVSAHAIHLSKICGFKFEVMIFTNLTEDHLDYFKTMDCYFEAKSRVFSSKFTKFAVLNIDDDYGKRLASSINIPFFTYSRVSDADFFASQIETNETFQTFKIKSEDYRLNMLGKFNVSNVLSCIAALTILKFDKESIKRGVCSIKEVDGRFNILKVKDSLIIIDYAHTPDGLANILTACRELSNGHKLITVFGCGGNRDKEKREIMGEVSSTLSDFVIITSDNPRFEKREDIARDIERGMKSSSYRIELERSVAIKEAISLAGSGDIVVIAGKGAENYIDENGVKIPYSDYAEVEKLRR